MVAPIANSTPPVPTRHRGRLAIAIAMAGGLTTLAACGSAGPGSVTDDATSASSTPHVIASTSIWADVAGNVACGGLADVDSIIPLGGDPHSFEASLSDRERMDDAALVITNGLLLEESLADTVDAVESAGVPVLRVGDSLDPIRIGEHHADHPDDDHRNDQPAADDIDPDSGDADPHVWFDPIRVEAALPTIADALAATGIDRAALDRCVTDYTAALEQLDSDVRTIVDQLPQDERLLVTDHDSLGYYADRYGFRILGTVIPSTSSLAESNPAELDALADVIERTGVPAIFSETQHSDADAEALADRVGDVDVISLLIATLGEPGSPADDYIGWLLQNTHDIVDGLTPA